MEKITTDLYRKPIDQCQYLLPSSCRPSHITKNIPFSLCYYRLIRKCREMSPLIQELDELKNLLHKNDPLQIIKNAIQRALLKRDEKKKIVSCFPFGFSPCPTFYQRSDQKNLQYNGQGQRPISERDR